MVTSIQFATTPSSTAHSNPVDKSTDSQMISTLKGVAYTVLGLGNAGITYALIPVFGTIHSYLPCLSSNPTDCYTAWPLPAQILLGLSTVKSSYDSFKLAATHFQNAMKKHEVS